VVTDLSGLPPSGPPPLPFGEAAEILLRLAARGRLGRRAVAILTGRGRRFADGRPPSSSEERLLEASA
jgi:hypothetical protein